MDIKFLLFFSIQKPAERYLSREIKDKTKSAKGKIKNLKSIISKPINKTANLIRKKTEKGKYLDNQIETAIQDIKNPEQETKINESLAKEAFKPKFTKYKTPVNEALPRKKSFKNPYKFFAGYVKSSYRTIKKFKKIPDLKPEQVGYEFDTYSKRFRTIRAPKINGKSYLTI